MIWTYIVSAIIVSFLTILLKNSLDYCKDPIKLKYWQVIIQIILFIIPVVNVIMCIASSIVVIVLYGEGDIKINKETKLVKWLNKEI